MKTHHWLPGLFVDSLQNKYNFFDIHMIFICKLRDDIKELPNRLYNTVYTLQYTIAIHPITM